MLLGRGVVNWNMTPCNKFPGKGLTDMGYPYYPPSLYRAISYSSSLGVPVYVTENGMACAEDNDDRTEWINGNLAQAGCPLLTWHQICAGTPSQTSCCAQAWLRSQCLVREELAVSFQPGRSPCNQHPSISACGAAVVLGCHTWAAHGNAVRTAVTKSAAGTEDFVRACHHVIRLLQARQQAVHAGRGSSQGRL